MRMCGAELPQPPKEPLSLKSHLNRLMLAAAALCGAWVGAYESVRGVAAAIERAIDKVALVADERVQTDRKIQDMINGLLDELRRIQASPARPSKTLDIGDDGFEGASEPPETALGCR